MAWQRCSIFIVSLGVAFRLIVQEPVFVCVMDDVDTDFEHDDDPKAFVLG